MKQLYLSLSSALLLNYVLKPVQKRRIGRPRKISQTSVESSSSDPQVINKL